MHKKLKILPLIIKTADISAQNTPFFSLFQEHRNFPHISPLFCFF